MFCLTSVCLYLVNQLGQTVSREQIQDVWHEEGVEEIERGEQNEEEDEEEENVIKPLHQRKFPRPSQTPSVSNGPKWFPSMVTKYFYINIFLYINIFFVSEINDDG